MPYMAHSSQKEFILACLKRFEGIANNSKNILEVGSQDINGSIRNYFPDIKTKNWLGLDIGAGRGVDFTIPGELIQLPNGWADIAFSTECFEHAKRWKEVFLNMIRCTHEQALVVITFAGPGRAAHGTVDTEQFTSPFTQDYYRNISLADFMEETEIEKYFSRYCLEANCAEHDTYFWGIRNASFTNAEWLSAEESLSRARGQMGIVIQQNCELKNAYKALEYKLEIANTPWLVLYRGCKKLMISIKRLFWSANSY